jgi:outer membrane protein OmpA-like peptidoglycan-associated protein
MFSNDDDSQGLAIGVVFGVIALVIGLVIGVSIYKTNQMNTPAPAATAAAASDDGASIKIENGVVKFYFATGNAEVAAGAKEALVEVLAQVAAGKKAVISGFHDATGDAAKNEELAKQRAFAVRDALKSFGVADDKLELKKPETTQADGSNAQARRVEVSVQ